MTDSTLSRRAFLAAGGGFALAAVAAPMLETWFEPAAAAVPAAKKGPISPLVLSSDLYASPVPQRFVFAIAQGKGPVEKTYASGVSAQVAFAAPGSSQATVLPTKLYKDGLPKNRGVYVAQATFPQAGDWKAILLVKGRKVPFAVQVKAAGEAPAIDALAPRAASPTKANPLGVNPICTRRPACPLHAVSLSDVVGTGKLVAVMFATPALCQSQYCGPVLDELLKVVPRYQDRITFVHSEIYTSNRGATLSPTVQAWNIPGEPWLYTVDGAGVIKGRIDGAFGAGEIAEQLDALIA